VYQPIGKGRERAANLIERAGYGKPTMAEGGRQDFSHMTSKHPDETEDRALIKKMVGKAKIRLRDGGLADGGMAPRRLDQRGRGGSKHGKAKTNIEINVQPHPPGQGPGGPMAGGMGTPGAGLPPGLGLPARPPAPPVPPPSAPPMGAGPPMAPRPMPPPGGGTMPPTGMPPGGMMPPRPMAKQGGRTDWGDDDAAANTGDDDDRKLRAQVHDIGDKDGGRSHGRKSHGGRSKRDMGGGTPMGPGAPGGGMGGGMPGGGQPPTPQQIQQMQAMRAQGGQGGMGGGQMGGGQQFSPQQRQAWQQAHPQGMQGGMPGAPPGAPQGGMPGAPAKHGGRRARGGDTATRLADGKDEYREGGRTRRAQGGRAGHEGGDNDQYGRREMTAGAGGVEGRIQKAARQGLPVD